MQYLDQKDFLMIFAFLTPNNADVSHCNEYRKYFNFVGNHLVF